MLMPVIQAYVGDITPPRREGFTMGLYNMFMLFGLSLGPLIGGVVKDQFSLQASFLCMGMLALLGFILCLFLLPPTQSERTLGIQKEPMPWKKLLFDKTIAALLSFRFAYVVCIGTIWGFLPLYVDLKLSPSSSAIGILIMLGIVISGSLNVPMGLLADRLNKKKMVTLGGVIVACAIFSFAWTDSYRTMVFLSIFFGLGGGICMPALMAMAAIRGNKNESMGSVMALLTAAHSLGMLTGALLGGILMDLFELRYAFSASAIVMAICTALFLAGTHDPRRPSSI
jgi:MFS family permease